MQRFIRSCPGPDPVRSPRRKAPAWLFLLLGWLALGLSYGACRIKTADGYAGVLTAALVLAAVAVVLLVLAAWRGGVEMACVVLLSTAHPAHFIAEDLQVRLPLLADSNHQAAAPRIVMPGKPKPRPSGPIQPMHPVGVAMCVAAGLFSLLGGWRNWEWYYAMPPASLFDGLLGRTAARIFYVLLGLFILVGGILGGLGLIE